MKREISTSTLLENLKNYGTWRLYQLWLVFLAPYLKDYQRAWSIWKLADEWRPSKRQCYWRWPEYWEESWRLEKTCCHSNSSEKPSAKTDVKYSWRVNNNNNNNNNNNVKKGISGLTLLENWKNYGNWRWRWYQL